MQTVMTEPDGFYLFEKVPFGEHTVRVSPQQLAKRGYKQPEGVQASVSSENDIVLGVEFILEREDAGVKPESTRQD